MGAYEFYNQRIFPHLEDHHNDLMDIEQRILVLPEEKEKEILDLEAKFQPQKEELHQQQMKLSTFIRMSSGGEVSYPVASGRISSLDIIELKRLAATEITTDRGYQRKLFDEACAQYRYVESQIELCDQQLKVQKSKIQTDFQARLEGLLVRKEQIEQEYRLFVESNDFVSFVTLNEKEHAEIEREGSVAIGFVQIPMPISEGTAVLLEERWPNMFHSVEHTVDVLYRIDTATGCVYNIEVDNSSEESAIAGLQTFIANTIRAKAVSRVSLFDPVHYNDFLLGNLSEIAGLKGSPLDKVPLSDNEITKQVSSIREEISRWESDPTHDSPFSSNRILILYQFPHEYSAEAIKSIRFVCVNAKRNGFTVFLVKKCGENSKIQNKELDYFSENAIRIYTQNEKLVLFDMKSMRFRWYIGERTFSEEYKAHFLSDTERINYANDYDSRIGFSYSLPIKGNRSLVNIPFGIDSNGNIATLSFEDENFGTFICGAARSGKTTLLHTLINGLLNHHPDDIEIWLIDFKKVEFGQYITHMPPHVRYILLENSPEIIFDIIDELTQKMNVRKDLFRKNGWTKLSDVPETRSMPTVIIIIDEFSEMSGVLSNSITLSNSGEDYKEKFRLLFSEGASFGFRFVLSCQAFSEGTRGLADFAKMQIQQRIILKSQKSEIKGTLDISNLSDEDQFLVENLEPHFAIQRVPLDIRGNRLKKVHVLYIKNKQDYFKWIDQFSLSMKPVRKYIFDDNSVYGDKLPVVIDGNSYESFKAKEKDITDCILQDQNQALDSHILLFIGTPLRMKLIRPIYLSKDYRENVLVIAPTSKRMIATSIVLSICESMFLSSGFTYNNCEIWGVPEDPIIKQVYPAYMTKIKIYTDIKAISQVAINYSDNISRGENANKIVIITSLDSIIKKVNQQNQIHDISPIALTPDYLGIRQRDKSDSADTYSSGNIDLESTLKSLFLKGAALGYHFIVLLNSTAAYNQCRLPDAFKHKILFRTAAQDASNLMIPAAEALYFSRLGEFQFRYTNGLDRNTYRPYFHPGLTWDNQMMDDSGKIIDITENDEDDYLV